MTNKDLANVIFPSITKTVEDYEKMYPERNLGEGAKVTRFAPSPTGYLHLGGFFQAIIDYNLANKSGGVFYLRIEDTDQKREVNDATALIMKTLKHYNIMPTEYEHDGEVVGSYGPYVQSERKEIYHAFIKHLIEIGRAYPCFCSAETLNAIRENQEKKKERTGYYGRYSTCRNITPDEAIKRIEDAIAYYLK